MKTYSKFRPTQFDTTGPGLEDRQDWMVIEVAQNRDSDVMTRCNFETARGMLETAAASELDVDTFEIHRFGHWGPGWFEIMLVAPGSAAFKEAEDIEAALADYPVLSDDRLSEMAEEEANEAWSHYRQSERIEYIRDHRSDHQFRCFSDLLACARGKFFAGDAVGFCCTC